jgi:tRNA(His) 5'-end guanylyltransferase
MSALMEQITVRLMKEFDAVYGYTESDEISLLLPLNFNSYDRQLGKLLSISSAIAASMFTLEMSKLVPLHNELNFIAFDSRVWHAEQKEDVVDYFLWRAGDAVRCGLNTWTYWTLRQNGYSPVKATRIMDGRGPAFKLDLLAKFGVNFDKLPAWQKRGIGFSVESHMKTGFNPKTGQEVQVRRRRIKADYELPEVSAYADYMRERIES